MSAFTMELLRYLRILKRQWLAILAAVVVGAGVGIALSAQPPKYETGATIYITPPSGVAQATNNPTLLASLARLSTGLPMLEKAIVDQHLLHQAGLSHVIAYGAIEPGTSLLAIEVVSPSPRLSAALANGLATEFVNVTNLGPHTGPGSLPKVNATLADPATIPGAPLPSGRLRRVVLLSVLGLVVGAGLVLLAAYLEQMATGTG